MIGKRLRKIIRQMFLILYAKEKEIYPAYISKINLHCERKIILLMIPNEEKVGWHYLAARKVSALLHGITAKHKGDFYCLNCLHSFRTENKIKSHENVCKNKDFCGILIPSENENILEVKMPCIIYTDVECLIKK